MKSVEELGISPLPWKAEDNLKSFPLSSCYVRCDAYDVAQNVLPHDARLISAAPELYKCLREAVIEVCNLTCESSHSECVKTVNECFVVKWRAALAKASGAEVAK